MKVIYLLKTPVVYEPHLKTQSVRFQLLRYISTYSARHHQEQSKEQTKMVKESYISKKRNYEDAINTLNGLQSNASVIEQIRKERGRFQRNNLPELVKMLERLKIDTRSLDDLNVIHISGTKGKGSVSAFCESIMRQSGYKTGLYTSPHLVEVRERIRIDGKPLDQRLFTKYFFECFDQLVETSLEQNDMPSYFRFLTMMAFHVFLQEKMEVVVMEVGIGGAYDSTNVIQNPVLCGITKLGLDHKALLGDTIEQIAWHKAGIMKPGRPAITVEQDEPALKILFQRASELKASLYTAPNLSEFPGDEPELGIAGEHQRENASLALQVCRLWLKEKGFCGAHRNISSEEHMDLTSATSVIENNISSFSIPESFLKGLKHVKWPGRCQVINRPNITLYLDGAHTPNSVKACVKWYQAVKEKTLPREKLFRILLFNVTGDRDVYPLLANLAEVDFDFAIFCPSILDSLPGGSTADVANFNVTRSNLLQNCDRIHSVWLSLQNRDNLSTSDVTSACSDVDVRSAVFPRISSAVKWLVNGRDCDIEKPEVNGPAVPTQMSECQHTELLVAGSLHLVGGLLKYLGPAFFNVLSE